MVDEDRVLRLLDRIRGDVERLARYAHEPPALDDEITVAGIKYLFVTAIEGCAKVAHHIGSAQGWAAAETNGDAVRELGRRDVLTPDLASAVADAVGFRNLLVHQYADVDDERVLGHLAHLDDLRSFVVAVTRWLLRASAEESYIPTER
ncbi:DUF86 domain-containing protein [Pseudonocardia sp.]|uniref:type VII toxin-antitoxin system HepT family RNase toxin n=1 Tax=Pseudonocardia sp. TaxID=60912 RepID=UPI0026031486|nr:DUF86 domain-containing protein [Pseudonocardia sp.]